ncbi:DUF423 domain-containing protein [Sediminicola luteus]|uniref:DUF423 domain-containing protein n=1 Tax=Sediminicola luteus TaxID=319238 RepID=A0A2A4G420_9FLAO|nr:DUF423 domain-containing protein [Sediminicola luteus]PCE62720.1 hypothetical protein B7P33_15615 [Sediminicola luteus]
MNKTIVTTACLLGAFTIGLGAFGAHGLKELVDAYGVATFKTGVQYQMYHVLFLLFLGVIPGISEKKKKPIFYLVLLGILLFSFSLYFLATNSLTAFDFKTIGFITPLGGLAFIVAWILSGYHLLKNGRFN